MSILLAIPCFIIVFVQAALAAEPDFDSAAKSARELLAELVSVDTTNPPGNENRAAEIVARRLGRAEVSASTLDFAPGRANLVARLKAAGGGGDKPVVLLGHLDVVGTSGQNWTSDPHKLVERDGFLYGRGVMDDLGMAAVNVETFLLLKRSGAALKRDVVLALVGDEESGGSGAKDLLARHRELLIGAAASGEGSVVFNEVGGPVLGADGKVKFVGLQAAEKVYQDFELVAHGKTGHSSVPQADNAIYKLSRALDRLGRFHFPVRLLDVTRAYLEGRAAVEPPRLAKAMRAAAKAKGAVPAAALKVLDENPTLAATLRTTCVATMLSGGTRVNSLAAEAKANVNCRILPDESSEDVRAALARVIGDAGIEIVPVGEFGKASPSPIAGEGPEAVRAAARALWPDAPIIPFLALGATDSRYTRAAGIPSYGLFPYPLTEEDARRAHGIDERIPAASLRAGVELYYRLLSELAAKR
jgi:acetylornithine deacetylase/succinyl-diaminopimelate desuccinylase-like protein